MQAKYDIKSDDSLRSLPVVIVMAKWPAPGRVKTRMTGVYSQEQAAAMHFVMLNCVLSRLQRCWPANCTRYLALDGPARDVWRLELDPACGVWHPLQQGEGDLGQRMLRVWRETGGGPAAFFGVDSPDVPMLHLQAIVAGLDHHEAMLGPVDDGGYWTIAARKPMPQLLEGIDWGSSSVYDQTLAAARQAEIDLQPLPPWHDVDEPADLDDLIARLGQPDAKGDPALVNLDAQLKRIREHGQAHE